MVGSKVKSRSDGHRNLVSSIATELLKESINKNLPKYITVVGIQIVCVFKVMGLKVKVTPAFASGGIQIDGALLEIILLLHTYYTSLHGIAK